MAVIETAPLTVHRSEDDLPFVDLGDLESPEAQNRAGSFLFEPAGSTHTLHVPADNTEPTHAAFVIHGANLNLADDGSVEMVIDAQLVLDTYRAVCAEQHGIVDPPVVVVDA